MQSVLITGASSGFGMSVALALASDGWRVFASMRDITRGGELTREAEARGLSDRIVLVAIDVTDRGSITQGVAQVLEACGGTLDALLNNAGYSVLGAFEDLSDEDCRHQMETNFFGTLAVTRAVLPAMRQARRGRIVVVTSNAVNTPHPMLSMYAASKWALEGWAEALEMEVVPFGIAVRVVQPGAHRTPFAQHVVPVLPPGSPYAPWMETAMPGISRLDAWGRDPAKAVPPLVRAVSAPDAPFRQAVGEDTIAFAALKGALPYEVRAWAVRAIVGTPEPDAYVPDEARPAAENHPAAPIIARLAAAAAGDSAKAGGALPRIVGKFSEDGKR